MLASPSACGDSALGSATTGSTRRGASSALRTRPPTPGRHGPLCNRALELGGLGWRIELPNLAVDCGFDWHARSLKDLTITDQIEFALVRARDIIFRETVAV